MVKVTLERIECDVCGEEGTRYTLSFPDGVKVLDRCEKHEKKIMALKNEKGDWTPLGGRSSGITVKTPEQIAAERKKA